MSFNVGVPNQQMKRTTKLMNQNDNKMASVAKRPTNAAPAKGYYANNDVLGRGNKTLFASNSYR